MRNMGESDWEKLFKSFIKIPSFLDGLGSKPKQEKPLNEMRDQELFEEMGRLYKLDKNIILPKDKIPEESRENYDKYLTYLEKLDRRYSCKGQSGIPPNTLIGVIE